jgi:predicted AAA+ superfamily ATPase
MVKRRYNQAKQNNLYFWRDSAGHEVDIIIEHGNNLLPVEIKSGQTVTSEYFKGIRYWQKLSGATGGFVIHAGTQIEKRSDQLTVIPYSEIAVIPALFE